MLEKQIQKQILSYLECLQAQGVCWFTRTAVGAVKVQRKDGSTGFFKTGRKGTPDIIACFSGRFVGIEVKTDKGKMSLDQTLTCRLISRVGGIYITARSVSELIDDLKELELIL